MPAADLVILYEPVASAIRAIQRRGTHRSTTGRERSHPHRRRKRGTNTSTAAAGRREAKMYTLLQRIHDRGQAYLDEDHHHPADVLGGVLSIQREGHIAHATRNSFEQESARKIRTGRLRNQRNRRRIYRIRCKKGKARTTRPTLNPVDRRPRQQMGLDQFIAPANTQAQPNPLENVEEKKPSSQVH